MFVDSERINSAFPKYNHSMNCLPCMSDFFSATFTHSKTARTYALRYIGFTKD